MRYELLVCNAIFASSVRRVVGSVDSKLHKGSRQLPQLFWASTAVSLVLPVLLPSPQRMAPAQVSALASFGGISGC